MNRKMVLHIFGRIALLEGALMLIPAVVSLIYGEMRPVLSFLVASGGAMLIGAAINYFVHPKDHVIYAREGFVTVTVAWIGMALIGAMPFVISGEIPNFIDAVFETMSGFTTTGATILTDIESLSRGILFWRSFTHWLGGMGVLVFIMAIANNFTDRSIHIMRAEMPGPVVGKLLPKVKDTAKILYLIYMGLTLLETVFLCFGGLSLYEALIHSFGTAGTGGFSIYSASIGAFSPYVQWVVIVFMLLFGVNFNLYFLLLIRRVKSALSSSELWFYLGIVAISTAIMTANIMPIYGSFGESFRNAAFQSASMVTTTGYCTTDFNTWPALSQGLVFVLMFLGGCAGSTAGGLKMSRSMLLLKMVLREFRKLLRPRSVSVVKVDGKEVDPETLRSVATYFALYMVSIAGTFLLICFEPFGLAENLSAAVSCVNNVGPAFGAIFNGYAGYSAFSKIVLTFAMLIGRVEIYPIIIALSPAAWKKR